MSGHSPDSHMRGGISMIAPESTFSIGGSELLISHSEPLTPTETSSTRTIKATMIGVAEDALFPMALLESQMLALYNPNLSKTLFFALWPR